MAEERTIWITGASSGIGAALARQLAKQGAHLILSGRNVAALEDVAAQCGGSNRHMILPFETTDYARIDALAEEAWGWRGRIDWLVNNAGISQRSLALDTQLPVYRKIVDVDLIAPIALTQAVLPRMAARKSGKLLFISSVAGKVGAPMRTAYSAAKHGLVGYADALRTEVTMLGIDVHVIAPGSVRTGVSRNALEGDGSVRGVSDGAIEAGMDPDHAARLMLRAIARGEREIIVAKGLERQMARMRRLAPNRLFDLMAGLVASGYAQRMKGE